MAEIGTTGRAGPSISQRWSYCSAPGARSGRLDSHAAEATGAVGAGCGSVWPSFPTGVNPESFPLGFAGTPLQYIAGLWGFPGLMPCVHKRVYPPPVQRLTPCWPYEHPLSSATYSVASLPCPLLALLDTVTANRQQCQAEECENFDDRVNKDQASALIRPIWYSGYVEPEPVVGHRDRKAGKGIRY